MLNKCFRSVIAVLWRINNVVVGCDFETIGKWFNKLYMFLVLRFGWGQTFSNLWLPFAEGISDMIWQQGASTINSVIMDTIVVWELKVFVKCYESLWKHIILWWICTLCMILRHPVSCREQSPGNIFFFGKRNETPCRGRSKRLGNILFKGHQF